MRDMQSMKSQVNEVTDIMRQNVARVMERDNNLHELESKAGDLVMGASQFQAQSTHLKRKMWWKNMKFMMTAGAVVLVLLMFFWVSHSGSSADNKVDTPGMSPVGEYENKILEQDKYTKLDDDDDYAESEKSKDDEKSIESPKSESHPISDNVTKKGRFHNKKV